MSVYCFSLHHYLKSVLNEKSERLGDGDALMQKEKSKRTLISAIWNKHSWIFSSYPCDFFKSHVSPTSPIMLGLASSICHMFTDSVPNLGTGKLFIKNAYCHTKSWTQCRWVSAWLAVMSLNCVTEFLKGSEPVVEHCRTLVFNQHAF